jgi:hypothetical protein
MHSPVLPVRPQQEHLETRKSEATTLAAARPKDPETTAATENYNPSSTREGEEGKEETVLPERTVSEVEMAASPSPPRAVASPLLLMSSPDVPPPPLSRPSWAASPLKPIHAVSSRRRLRYRL